MAISSVGSSYQMQQMQMRKMDGSGGGQGGNQGMRDIMQSLSQEDRTVLKEQMSSLDQAQRADLVSQMKAVDKTTMNEQDYIKTLLDIVNQDNQTTSTASTSVLGTLYA